MASDMAVNPDWALATLVIDGKPVACLEVDGNCHDLSGALAAVGAPAASSVASLFEDWRHRHLGRQAD